jgi:hypothetical protein
VETPGKLVLDRFEVSSGERSVGSGEWLQAARPVLVSARWHHTAGASPPLTVRLIRDGDVVLEGEAGAAGSISHRDERLGGATRSYYRLEISGGDQILLANPIFVDYGADPTGGGR